MTPRRHDGPIIIARPRHDDSARRQLFKGMGYSDAGAAAAYASRAQPAYYSPAAPMPAIGDVTRHD